MLSADSARPIRREGLGSMRQLTLDYRTVWVKPPEVSFNGIEAPESGSEVTVQTNGFLINFRLNVS